MMSDVKIGSPDHPVHEFVARRWSPYAFSDRRVARADLLSLFEAARWAPSSYNEQPWSYIVATKDDAEHYERVLSCLIELNQTWAKAAPVLALGVVTLRFKRNDKPNKAAVHDLGLAAGNLLFEATARGLSVHQMIGINPDRARELFAIPEGSEAYTGIAIGYPDESDEAPEALRLRDQMPRIRKPLDEFVFGAEWGKPAKL
jgi:nitroreductase